MVSYLVWELPHQMLEALASQQQSRQVNPSRNSNQADAAERLVIGQALQPLPSE